MGKEVEIPNKLFFGIGEVSGIVGVEPHVLRYWESEFPSLRPGRAGSKRRRYRRKDIELVLEIKKLLYDKRFTIAGAKKILARKCHTPTPVKKKSAISLQSLREILNELKLLRDSLD